MSTVSAPLRLRQEIVEASGAVAAALGGGGHCALLFWGGQAEVEVLHRDGLSLELCSAFSTEGGKNLLAWARKSGAPHRIRKESLGAVAPALAKALGEHDVESMALVPLLGDRGVVGFVCVDLPEEWEAEAESCTPLATSWCRANRTPGLLQLKAENAALRTVLKVRETEPPGGLHGLVVLDEDSRVLFAHGFLRELPDWNSDEVFGRHIKSLPGGKILAAIGLDSPERLLWKERRLPGKDARGIPVAISASALHSEPPGPAHSTVYLLRDLREPQEGEEGTGGAFLLELAMRISHLSHQLKCERNEEGADLPAALEGELEESDVLLRSALSVSDTDQARDPVDLGSVLKELQTEYAGDFMEERIQILPIVSPDLPAIAGDARRLKTAFRILMLTSRTSLQPNGGTIFLRAWEDDGNVFCTVSDDGPGMEEAEVEELMALEPLFGEDGEGARPETFGAVRGVVEELGGRLHVESRPQLWTRFTVMVPALRVPSTAKGSVGDSLPPAVEVRSRKPGALEVLVVDDNDDIRAILRRFLEKRGHLVTEAGDGSEALELVRGQEFDRLMVDIYMPGFTGTDFYQGLDTVAPSMKDRTIFMTGGLQDATVEEYLASTGRPSLEKPFDLVEMVRTIEG